MKIKWLRVVRDVVIVTIILFIGGIVAASGGIPTSKVEMLLPSILMSIIGFCLCGCLTIENRWKHLFIVAVGVWLINCLPSLPNLPVSLLAYVLNVSIIFIPMIIGGAISVVLVKAPRQIECRVDEPEKKENSKDEHKE